jgi:hypothetical protein
MKTTLSFKVAQKIKDALQKLAEKEKPVYEQLHCNSLDEES